MEACQEEVTKLIEDEIDLINMRDVAGKGEKQYIRTRNSASAESAKRSKVLGSNVHLKETHMLFGDNSAARRKQDARENMLARVSGFRPPETIFEVGNRGTKGAANEAAEVMRKRRTKVKPRMQQRQQGLDEDGDDNATGAFSEDDDVVDNDDGEGASGLDPNVDLNEASEDELEVTFSQPSTKKAKRDANSWQDSEHFMGYTPSTINMAEDRGYGVQTGADGRGSNFLEAARGATMDLTNDDSKSFGLPSKAQGLRWDKKAKNYVARVNDEDGSKGAKMIQGESGLKIAASFRSGRFDAWKKANKIDVLPRVGETERSGSFRGGPNGMDGGRRFKHKAEKAPKEADKYRDDYFERKKKVEAAKEKRIGKFANGSGKSEIKGADDVYKDRQTQQKRKDKNARPTGGRGGRGGGSRGGSTGGSRGSSRGGSRGGGRGGGRGGSRGGGGGGRGR